MSVYDLIDLVCQGFQVVIDEEDLDEFVEAYGNIEYLTIVRVNGEVYIKER